jgi:gephyrin
LKWNRLTSGIRGRTLIVNFPGSAKAAKECFEIILPVLVHAVAQLRNDLSSVKRHHQAIQGVNLPGETSDGVKSEHVLETSRNGSEEAVCDRPRHSPFPLLSIHSAVRIILKEIDWTSDLSYQNIPINSPTLIASILKRDVCVPFDMPPCNASLKDGYALLAEDGVEDRTLIGAAATAGTSLVSLPVLKNECVRISTGAFLPSSCDAVVQVEDTELLSKNADGEETCVRILKTPKKGQDIRRAGSDAKTGDCLVTSGTKLSAVHLGMCASVGLNKVPVYLKPTIAVLSTGDELLEPGETLKSGKVYDSNSTLIVNLLKEKHFDSYLCTKVEDNKESLTNCITEALQRAQVLITSGGVSMGERDFLKPVLISHFGAKIHIGRVNMKPGKPFTFATCILNGQKKWIFALPGNPVSAYVTCQLFVVPALLRLSGVRLDDTLERNLSSDGERDDGEMIDWLFRVHRTCKVRVPADQFLHLGHNCCDDNRPEFVRAHIEYGESMPIARLVRGSQASSRLISLMNADIFVYFDTKIPGVTKAIFM